MIILLNYHLPHYFDYMNITVRFNELINNFNPKLTTIMENKFVTDKYILYETHIEYNIYDKHESYDKITIRNKETNRVDVYYLDGIRDIDVYAMLYFKLSDIQHEPKQGTKRKADDVADLEHSFKKLKLDKSNKHDEIIEDIQTSLKRKRFDDDNKPINKKQKI